MKTVDLDLLIEIQPGRKGRTPLFLVHGVGGGMFMEYAQLASLLGEKEPVYAFTSRGAEGGEEFKTIDEMASHYVDELLRLQKTGPYRVGGYCFGGNVAYEMARILKDRGREVELVLLMNSAPPNSSYFHPKRSVSWALKWVVNAADGVRAFTQWPADSRRVFYRWQINTFSRRILRLLRINKDVVKDGVSRELLNALPISDHQRKVWPIHAHALATHRCHPYSGKVTLYRASVHRDRCNFARDYGWSDYVTGGVDVKVFPGVHRTFMDEPYIQKLSVEIRALLDELDGKVVRPAPVEIPNFGIVREA